MLVAHWLASTAANVKHRSGVRPPYSPSFHSRRAQIQISSPGDSTDAASIRLGPAVRGPQTGFVLTSVRLDSMHITPTIRGLTYKVVIAYLGQDERSTVTTAKP